MAQSDQDDLNHLLLSCHFKSELGSGVRYAYARLDTIDRKASELFRSFTWVVGLLGGLAAVIRQALVWPQPGNPAPSQILILVCFILLVATALVINVIHRQITNLRYYRIGIATLNAAQRLDQDRLTARDRPVYDYLKEISVVTVTRERRLAIMANLHTAGMIVAAVLLICLVSVAAPFSH